MDFFIFVIDEFLFVLFSLAPMISLVKCCYNIYAFTVKHKGEHNIGVSKFDNKKWEMSVREHLKLDSSTANECTSQYQ